MYRTLISKVYRIMFVNAAAVMLLALFSLSVSAVSETGRTDYFITDGVSESEVYVTDSLGRNVRAHILMIDNNAGVSIKASSANYYKKGGTSPESRAKYAAEWDTGHWGFATVQEQMQSYEQSTGGTVIAAINGDFYDDNNNGHTLGLLMMEGNEINGSAAEPYFAVLKDGTRIISEASGRSDIEEAVSGFQWLVRDGHKADNLYDREWKVLTAIGLTSDKDLVIVAIDGRDIISYGTTIEDLSNLMMQLGCTDSIQLDSGGSSSFLTRRAGEESCLMRNVASDGVPRPVSSALLIAADGEKSEDVIETVFAPDMTYEDTCLTLNEEGQYQYIINGEVQTGFQTVNGESFLFDAKGKGMTRKIKIGGITYYYEGGFLSGCSDDNAGRIGIGFCGADQSGRNLIFAYQYGNKRLNIGKNPLETSGSGKMAGWQTINEVPWQVKIHEVKTVYVGAGVTNIGRNFLYISKYPFNRDLASVNPALYKVSLPSSLKAIGYRAFRNQSKLKKVTIPRNVKKIYAQAFSLYKGSVITFKGKTPPAMSNGSFRRELSKTKKITWKVPKTKKWKALANNKKKRNRIGFFGKVKYYK